MTEKDFTESGKYLILEEHRVGGVLLGIIRMEKAGFLKEKAAILKEKGQRGYGKYLVALGEANLITVGEKLAADALNKEV